MLCVFVGVVLHHLDVVVAPLQHGLDVAQPNLSETGPPVRRLLAHKFYKTHRSDEPGPMGLGPCAWAHGLGPLGLGPWVDFTQDGLTVPGWLDFARMG